MQNLQVIVNKSRAEYRAIISKVPLQIEDLNRIPKISDDIKSMLRSNVKVFLGKEAPYCYLSRIENSYAELTLGYNLKHMVPTPSLKQIHIMLIRFSTNPFCLLNAF